jgi:ribosomal-protein-serine acetyltransferase
MEYLLVKDTIHLELLKNDHARQIFDAIDQNRSFLRIWLPFVDYTRKRSDTELFIKQMTKNLKKNQDYIYTIWVQGIFAGLVGFKDTDPVNNKTEIGYWLVESMQGKGIITLSVKKLVDFAFRNLDRNRIQIKVARGNEKSAAIPKRIGFLLEGIERNGERSGNQYHDLEVYSMLKNEWIERLLKDF